MKNTIGLFCLCGFLLCAFPSPSARAVSTSTDYTSLWWNASESGWGMNVIQQEQILFITLFIYGAAGTPTWLVGSNVGFVSANAAGDRTYTGDLYATTGTPFSTTPFNPAATTVLPVGKITFVGLANGTATVQYTAGAASVSKAVVRQTWAQPQFALNQASAYAAAQTGTAAGCVVPGDNGSYSATYSQLSLYINSVGSTMRLEITVADEETGTCILQGNNYVQEGRYGKATLTGRCSFIPPPAPNIIFEASEVDVGASYFTLKYRMSQGLGDGCVETGTMAGARK